MQIHVLASGSTGNATYIEMENTKLLVDAGISARRIKQSLDKIGTKIEDIDGVLITHEHRDHVNGLTTLLKKYNLPTYTQPDTWQAMYCRNALPETCCKLLSDSFTIGKVKIEPFSISHDAADPVGFRLYAGSSKVCVATDLGFVTPTVKAALALSDAVVLEANHDVDMLKNGSYPWYLKKRIMSNRGHLANTDAGWTLARLDRKAHTHVFLAHLSQENNSLELAEKTVADILITQGCKLGQDITLHRTYPEQISGLSEHK
ncbi:Metal-dependent hydrolase of the beta-lactamase superfamily I [uncultured Sporomusa sp.]|uniref:Metal-dependent hydrolase of the beta-lactamase superfamily I n=1 Tax=uncultured Sporomusa sp. TaxID=307249 RepID=A0A212LZ66_9FIRM|nr:MBL fold metallo-hydrolase [uncultured Sporomusa sp.]SCM82842.1 Metal-dependent hydrolase of the beta-lactamase superfamily I [uncultured Sporomusa sp.]